MPNRILKESICTSDDVDVLDWFSEVFFYRLIVNCDDFGRMDARPAILRARLFPLKDVKTTMIESAVDALHDAGLIDLYWVKGRPFIQLRTWEQHQQIRAKKSKYPGKDEANPVKPEQQPAQHSTVQQEPADVQQDTAPASTPEQEEAKPQQPKAKRFTPPTVEDVQRYAQEHGYTLEADRFVDFYASKGWMVGKSPMRDWQAAVRGWAAKDRADKAAKDRADKKVLPSARAPVKAVEQQRYSQREYADHSAQDLARMMAEWGTT